MGGRAELGRDRVIEFSVGDGGADAGEETARAGDGEGLRRMVAVILGERVHRDRGSRDRTAVGLRRDGLRHLRIANAGAEPAEGRADRERPDDVADSHLAGRIDIDRTGRDRAAEDLRGNAVDPSPDVPGNSGVGERVTGCAL